MYPKLACYPKFITSFSPFSSPQSQRCCRTRVYWDLWGGVGLLRPSGLFQAPETPPRNPTIPCALQSSNAFSGLAHPSSVFAPELNYESQDIWLEPALIPLLTLSCPPSAVPVPERGSCPIDLPGGLWARRLVTDWTNVLGHSSCLQGHSSLVCNIAAAGLT